MNYKKLAVLTLSFGLLFSLSSVCVAQGKANPKDATVKPKPAKPKPPVPGISKTVQVEIDETSKINPTRDENSPSKLYLPKDLEDAFIELNKMLHPKFIEKFKDGGKDAVIGQHFGLGIWMRNNWGLWSGSRLAVYFRQLGVNHPDDMSGIILNSYQLHLNGKPLEIEKQVDYYKRYWKAAAEPRGDNLVFPQCKSGVNSQGDLDESATDDEIRIIHFGYCKANKKLWVYEYDKGWYLPTKELKKKIEN